MKKILILNYEYPPLGGGGGVAAKKLAEAWIKMGYSVDCVTTWMNGLNRHEVVNGVNIYRVPVWGKRAQSNAGMLTLLTFPFCAYKITSQLCRKNAYAFINTHFAVPTGPLGVWISKKYHIKNILSLHGGDIYDPTKRFSPHKWWVFRKCISWVLKKSDVIVAQSSNTSKNTSKYYNYDQNKIQIIPLPYKKFNFKSVKRMEIGMDEERKYIISVGRLVRRKGYCFLLDILSQLPDVNLIIIGEGPEKNHLKEKAKQLHLENRVVFTGNISDELKFQYLENSDVYVLSSVHEGFGIVLQEAMQVGLPIVSTDYGGQIDIIEENKNGILVKYGDIKAGAEAIQKLLSNQQLSEKMRAENLKKIIQYSAENVAEKYLKVL